MSVVDQLMKLTAPKPQSDGRRPGESDQLKDLEEVEATLKGIGVTLEPRFDISLAARIGAATSKA